MEAEREASESWLLPNTAILNRIQSLIQSHYRIVHTAIVHHPSPLSSYQQQSGCACCVVASSVAVIALHIVA